MKLYVIRHGETEMGKNEIIATEDEPLNKFGMYQAQKVGKELKKLDIDIIYCSPIERAKHTLKLFDMDKNIPVIIDERIKERNMGIYEKVPFNELDWDVFWNYISIICIIYRRSNILCTDRHTINYWAFYKFKFYM